MCATIFYRKILDEAALLTQLHHKNIAKILGLCVQRGESNENLGKVKVFGKLRIIMFCKFLWQVLYLKMQQCDFIRILMTGFNFKGDTHIQKPSIILCSRVSCQAILW